MRIFFPLVLVLALVIGLSAALADEGSGQGKHPFHKECQQSCREGHWLRGIHNGRDGWWWMVDGLRYFYPVPVYPYPELTEQTVIVFDPDNFSPAGVPLSEVYYCADPVGYYPEVQQCLVSWQRIPSSGAPTAPPIVVSEPTRTVIAPMPESPVIIGGDDQQTVDNRRFNIFAIELDHVDLRNRAHARRVLNVLAQQVETFRRSLHHRDYNAANILQDTENLQHRIETKLALLPKAKRKVSVCPPAGVVPSKK